MIGYDKNEGKHEQTGSHNLILGEEQTFTSYGGVLAGFRQYPQRQLQLGHRR